MLRQVFVVVLSWLVAMSSTAVAVAVQRVDGSAVDTGPMFRRLEVPFSRLTVHAVSAAHTVLRVLLVFWFSAAYRGFMLLGIMAEGIVKLMFSMWYCPIQRSPTDRCVVCYRAVCDACCESVQLDAGVCISTLSTALLRQHLCSWCGPP